LAATLPFGATSESSPWIGFSVATMTRNGAPFHGAIGAGSTAMSAASSQAPPCAIAFAPEKTKNAPTSGNMAAKVEVILHI